MDNTQPVGFFALWHNKPSEYHATPEEERETVARIQQAFKNARDRGVRMFGRYGCRWSAERQYFTFWICPDLVTLEATMDELEQAGDFKFADSEHIIGVLMSDAVMTDEKYVMRDTADPTLPLGFFAIWRQTDSFYHAGSGVWTASDQAVRGVFDQARKRGVCMLGRYDCRWSTQWEYFTFWLAPDLETMEAIMDELEAVGDFWFADSWHIIGNLEPRFRFGNHLQTEPG